MLSAGDARSAVDSVDATLDNTKNQLIALRDDPNLPKVFGGLVSGLTSGDPSAGSYNVLPNMITAGSPAAQTAADLDAVKNQASTVVINAMKESSGKMGGSTGLGRILQQEFAAWSNFFGTLKTDTTVEGAKKTLQNMINFIDETKKRHAATYKADYGDTGIYPDQAPPPPPGAESTSNALSVSSPGAVPHKQTPEQTRSVLTGAPEGATGTLHLSNGTSVKAVKKNGHWYDSNSGNLIPGG
jgi:hypothetical protein